MSATDLDDQDASVDAEIRLADSVFEWCVRNVSQQVARGLGEQAIQWALLAGKVANSFCSSSLADEKLESALRRIGLALPMSLVQQTVVRSPNLRWLHVLTCAYETGGHTALCRRWIELDQSRDIHNLALVGQEGGGAKYLQRAVDRKAGKIHVLDSPSAV